MEYGSNIGSDNADLRRQQKALSVFGKFAFRESNLQAILQEAVRVCAYSLNVPFAKICRYRLVENDLLVVAGQGWKSGVVGYAISMADESTPQGRAFITRAPQICPNIQETSTFVLPPFYRADGILSTIDVVVAASDGPPFGVLEVDSQDSHQFSEYDIDFLTGFANVLAEAVATAERLATLRQTADHMKQLFDERETLSQELKHRVRNSLHHVYGLLTTEFDSGHEASSVVVLRSIAARVMGLAEVFDHLLGVGMTRVIDFSDCVVALCYNIPNLYQNPDISLTCDAEPFRLELDDATALGIVVTELVTNSYLHAFPRGSGVISVVLRIVSGHAILTINDDGIGFDQIETTRRGIGLVRRLVQQVNGRLSHRSDDGTVWTVVVAVDSNLNPAAAA